MAAAQKTQAPRNALAAAAAKKAALAAVAPAVKEELDDFDNAEGESEPSLEANIPVEEAEPEVRTRKQSDLDNAEKKSGKKTKGEAAPIALMDDFVRNKKGEIRKDEDGDEMRYAPGFHPQVGFVNENGVRFPVGWKFKGGFIGTFGTVVLSRCPKCHGSQGVDASRTGKCENRRAGPDGKQVCDYDQVRELEAVGVDEIG